jgi:hypothetical protein
MAVLACFSYGIFLEKLRYHDIGNLAVHGIDKICLRYYGIEYPPMPPSMRKVIVLGVQQAAKSSYNVGVRCQLGRKSCSFPQSHLCPLFIVHVCVMIVL